MPQSYQRYFMVLCETSAEFTMQGKKALGKCIIEVKGGNGKIIFSVQNIKPGNIHSAYIVAADGNSSTAVEIGRIAPDNSGLGQIKWECNANNVENSGIALENFNVAGLMKIEGANVTAPLVGYKNDEINWKNQLKLHIKRDVSTAPPFDDKPHVEPPTDTAETLPRPEDEPTYPPSTYEEPEILYATAPEDFFETAEEGAAEKTFKLMAQKINEKLTEIDALELEGAYKADGETAALSISLETTENINMIFRNCSKIRLFKHIQADTEWVRITPNELAYLPLEYESLQKDLFISDAYKKFGHLILGRTSTAESVVITLGVPDIYDKKTEKMASFSGLSSFACCDCGDILEGKHGYRLKSSRYLFTR